MKYLKVFTDFLEQTETLSDAEMGRLIRAMLSYASDPSELPTLSGSERHMWATAKLNIDRERESYEHKSIVRAEAGSKGGLANASKRKQTLANDSKNKQLLQDKDKEKDNISLKRDSARTPFDASLEEFRKYRRQLGKKLTPLAETKLLNELERLAPGDDATKIAILDQSICNGWTGVFPLKGKKDHGYKEHPSGNLDALLVDLDAEGGEHDASAKWTAV